ncbi:type II secretion system protein [Massilia varians]|uniref:type II secretion system protein n=1 Tax=Massilia varians TaxID=457921 RepID=UPI0024915E30|nr:type II secretion system protein [Massilia varians]
MRARRQAGFTYLGLIIFVFILGMVGAATLKIGSLLQRAHAEQELLEIGYQFSTALRTYAEATPRGQPAQPLTLQELLRDTRFPNPRRHLRKIFVDPVSGKDEWGLVRAGDGGRILGVYSLSQARPLKVANFDQRFPGFGNREHIADWKFMAEQQGAAAPLQPPAMAPQPQPGAAPPAPPAPQTPAAPPAAEPPPPVPEPEAARDEPPAEEPAPDKPAEADEATEPKEPKEPPGQSQDSGH